MSKYCVYSGRDCEVLPSTEEEIWNNAYQQGKADGIEEFANAFIKKAKELQFHTGKAWYDFDAGIENCLKIIEQLKEKTKNVARSKS